MPLWYTIVLFHVIRFPQAWVDLLGLGLTVALILLIAPLGAALGLGALTGYPLALIAGFFLWMYGTNRIYALEALAWPQQNIHLRRRSALSPEAMRAGFFLRPDAQVGLYECGPANENGVFEVVSRGAAPMVPLPCLEEDDTTPALSEDLQNGVYRFWATVIRSEPDYQETMFITEPDGEDMAVETTIQSLTPAKGGTLYEKSETTCGMGWVSGFGFWLNDVDADYFTATIDHITDRPVRAVRAAGHDTIITLLARRITRRRIDQMHRA